MGNDKSFDQELAAIKTVHDALAEVPEDRRRFVLGVVMERLEISADPRWLSPAAAKSSPTIAQSAQPVEVADGGMTVKEFLRKKMPRSDVERVTCLGAYLEKYRGEKTFKTRDLTKLNMEAAWPNFSNAATAVNNAHKISGYIMPAGGGKKQLTIKGEKLVEALPDRAAVQQALSELGKGSVWKAKPSKNRKVPDNAKKDK